MPRLNTIDPESSTGKAKDLLAAVNIKLGMVPNMTRAMANEPAVLSGYLQLSAALQNGTLSAKTREQIALAVAQANDCEYCLAAHSAIGKMVGLTDEQIRDSRLGTAIDARTEVLIRFARQLMNGRGRVSDADLLEVREVGFGDGVIAEVIANVALHLFTNYFNIANQTVVDFPKAAALTPQPAVAV